MSQRHFLVCGLRSGTAWTANFLTDGVCGQRICGHDMLGSSESVRAFAERLKARPQPYSGAADTAVHLMYDQVVEALGESPRVLVIRRSTDEIEASLERYGLPAPRWVIEANQHALDDVEGRKEAVGINYRSWLFDPEAASNAWHHLFGGEPFPVHRWRTLQSFRVERKLEDAKASLDRGMAVLIREATAYHGEMVMRDKGVVMADA